MPMTWETNIDRAYKIGMYMLSNKTIFDDNSKMIKELKDKCQNIRESNDSEVKKYVEDFQTVLSKFDEKNKLIETGKKYNMENGWIFDQFLKLSKANEDHNVKKQKSKILLDKISFYESSIIQINKILNFAYEKLEKYMDLNNEKIIINLKLILKSTENYNIEKLRRAAEKFQQSKELGDFKFGRMNPKLAHLLSLDDAFKAEDKPEEVPTPFGSIWIQKSKNKNDKSRMIYVDENCTKAPTYDEISKELDFKFRPTIRQKYRKDAIVNIIMPIINYIKQKLDENFEINKQNIVSSIEKWCENGCNKANLKHLSDKQKKCAACLCGTLLFSESHEIRNPTGGKFERKAMKYVLELAENGCTNPFGVVFSREKSRYVPARSDKTKENEMGGVKQTKIILEPLTKENLKKITDKSIKEIINEYKINIKEYFEFNTNEFKVNKDGLKFKKYELDSLTIFEIIDSNIKNFVKKFKSKKMIDLFDGLRLLLKIKYEKENNKDISVKPLELPKETQAKLLHFNNVRDYDSVKNNIDNVYNQYLEQISIELKEYEINCIEESNYENKIDFLNDKLNLDKDQEYYLAKLKFLYDINADKVKSFKISDLPSEPSNSRICKIINQAIRDSKKINKLMNNSIKKSNSIK